MKNTDSTKKDVTTLSARQQIGLYVVLTTLHDEENRPFYSSDFAREMRKFITIQGPDEYRKAIGGILGALSKNQLLKKMSSDKDPLWMLPEEIHREAESYKRDIFPITTIWS